ncbi:MAG: hypothetical protein JNK23_08165 [Opitutaceae bacterium]|nr:hypothetical protein [Opitutaceae bacterium]
MVEITGSEKLTDVFGKWPSFHDAEVLSVTAERTDHGAAVSAVVHLAQPSAAIDGRGRYVLTKQMRVVLRFHRCDKIKFANFSPHNVLFELVISRSEGEDFAVEFDPTCGFDGSLRCRAVEVVDVSPRA